MNYRYLYFSLLILILINLSCVEDDSSNTSLNTANIEGLWIVSEINSIPTVDLESNGNTNANLMNQTTCFDGMSLDFDANGNLTVVSSEITFDSTATPSFSCELRTDTGTYVISGSDLTVTIPISGTQETQTILVDVQSNTLTFSLTQNDIVEFFSVPEGESFSAINELEFVYLKN